MEVPAPICLPPEVLEAVISRVPLPDRLGCCSLVASSWRAATAATVTSIEMHSSSNSLDHVLAWLFQHGKHVKRLDLCPSSKLTPWKLRRCRELRTQPLLACSTLRELQLGWFDLSPKAQENSSGGVQGEQQLQCSQGSIEGQYKGAVAAIGSLTTLTKLVLTECRVGASTQSLEEAVGALSRLQHLGLHHLKHHHSVATLGLHDTVTTIAHSSLQLYSTALRGLTHLQLDCVPELEGEPATTHPITCFTRLQELVLGRNMGHHSDGKLLALSRDGTGHGCWLPHGSIRPSHALPDGLASLTSLRRLSIDYAGSLDVSLLTGLTLLRRLDVMHTPAGSTAALSGLLAWLPRLKHLRHLGMDCRLGPLATPAPAAAYAALTANSCLEVLDLSSCTLPMGAWQQLFPDDGQQGHEEARRLPHLHTAILAPSASWDDFRAGELQLQLGFPQSLNAADLKRIVRSCPRLRLLCVRTSGSLKPLLSLRHLRSLSVVGIYNKTVTRLAQLHGLEFLHVDGYVDLSCCRVLSTLTQLRELHIGSVHYP